MEPTENGPVQLRAVQGHVRDSDAASVPLDADQVGISVQPFQLHLRVGQDFVDGFQLKAWVSVVLSIPAPFSVILPFSSSVASSTNVPAASSIVSPSFALFTAATSSSVVRIGSRRS